MNFHEADSFGCLPLPPNQTEVHSQSELSTLTSGGGAPKDIQKKKNPHSSNPSLPLVESGSSPRECWDVNEPARALCRLTP
ncbi:hypothetical protein ANANG_G00197550 [Anguilla anguilla]|uniref:Uncharacterized protein n=1 Tax=Anguilla anguilla TaxID=7936 RepID=A0A9D3M2A0_ANGAN|nr:hypothetical protein ANANG_G00197550 [Anguilla anguilla]